ncbi:MAG: hypothetical protein WDW19_04300 [Neisseriaceae bacterium]
MKMFKNILVVGLALSISPLALADGLKVLKTSNILEVLAKVPENTEIATLFEDAKPTLGKFIGAIACKQEYSRYLDTKASSFHPVISPFYDLAYHKAGCLKILRVSDLTKEAANAFHFKVQYMSPQSEETTFDSYVAVKQPEGDWLFHGY